MAALLPARSLVLLGALAVLLTQAGCLNLGKGPAEVAGMPSLPPAGAPAAGVELPPNQALQACLAVAQSLDKNKDDQGASEQYEKVLRLDPGNGEASRRLAVLYDRRGDFSKADAEYRKATKARPRDADLLNDWGYSYYLRNNWVEAEKHLRRAVELDRSHVRARSNLGLVLGQQGRYAEALATFREAGTTEAEAHCNLAFVYWSQGKLDEARREGQAARGLDPACSKAQELLVKLDQPPPAPAASPDSRMPPKNSAARLPAPRNPTGAAAPFAAPGALPDGAGNVAYRSPSGIGWVPVKPEPAPAPEGPATDDGGVPGTVTFN